MPADADPNQSSLDQFAEAKALEEAAIPRESADIKFDSVGGGVRVTRFAPLTSDKERMELGGVDMYGVMTYVGDEGAGGRQTAAKIQADIKKAADVFDKAVVATMKANGFKPVKSMY